MSHDSFPVPGTTLADSIEKVLEFAAKSGHPIPRNGTDVEPVEVEVTRRDGSIVVRARENELVHVEISNSLHEPHAKLSALIVEAANEALTLARDETMAQFESMPSLQTIQNNVAGLQREVSQSYRAEMAQLAEMTRKLSQ